MSYLVGFVLLGSALMLQTSVFSHLRLLQGTTDLVLLTLLAWVLQPRLPRAWIWPLVAGGLVGWVSALPWPAALLAYLLAGGLALFLRQHLWQTSLGLYLFLVPVGTTLVLGLTWATLWTQGVTIPWREAFTAVLLPSALLNVLVALPVHSLVAEAAAWALPAAEEEAA